MDTGIHRYIDTLSHIGFENARNHQDLWELPADRGHGIIKELIANDNYIVLKADYTPGKRLFYDYKNDNQAFLEITWLHSGDTGYIEDGIRKRIENTLLAYYGKHGEGTVFYEPDVPVRYVTIVISEYYYKDYLSQRFPSMEFNPIHAKKAVEACVSNLQLKLIFKQILDYNGEGMSAALFYESKLLEVLALVSGPYCPCDKKIANRDRELVERAQHILLNSLSEPPTIPQLAQMLCVNTTTLKAKFKQASNCTIRKYVTTMRMEKAYQLLLQGEYSIGQIANTVGYASQSKFTEVFKESFGFTPQQARK